MTRRPRPPTRLSGIAGFVVFVVALIIGVTSSLSAPAAWADTTLPPSVNAAVSSAEADAAVAVAVLDLQSGDYYGSLQDETPFPAESVVKVLIAAKLLATGQMTGSTEQMAYEMITTSDDDDADALWGTVGGPDVVRWAADRYGITDLGSAPTSYGWWGNTKFTAHGLVELYAAVSRDPSVGPWLVSAMGQMSAIADDGTDQRFGLAAQTTEGAFKQGWGGDDDASDSEQLNSTGLLDDGRYAVAVMVQHVPYEPMDDLVPTIDAVAAAVAPDGQVVPPTAAGATGTPNPAGDAAATATATAPAGPTATAKATAKAGAKPAAAGASAGPRSSVLATSPLGRSDRWGRLLLLGALAIVLAGMAGALAIGARRRRPVSYTGSRSRSFRRRTGSGRSGRS